MLSGASSTTSPGDRPPVAPFVLDVRNRCDRRFAVEAEQAQPTLLSRTGFDVEKLTGLVPRWPSRTSDLPDLLDLLSAVQRLAISVELHGVDGSRAPFAHLEHQRVTGHVRVEEGTRQPQLERSGCLGIVDGNAPELLRLRGVRGAGKDEQRITVPGR